MEKSSTDVLEEKRSQGENLVRTFISREQKRRWTTADYKRFAHDYIMDDDLLEEYTNEDQDGYIDLAEINGINLNDDKDFRRDFWHDCRAEFSLYLQNEDQAVRRGALIADGVVSSGVKDA